MAEAMTRTQSVLLPAGGALLFVSIVLPWVQALTPFRDHSGAWETDPQRLADEAVMSLLIAAIAAVACVLLTRTPLAPMLGLRLPDAGSRAVAIARLVAFSLGIAASHALLALAAAPIRAAIIDQSPSAEWAAAIPFANRLGMALYAGTTEELAFVAVPVAIVLLLGVIRGRSPIDAPWSGAATTWLVAALAVGVLARASMHASHDLVSVGAAVAWGSVSAFVYARCRSIYPLIAGHAIFNLTIPGAFNAAAFVAVIGAGTLATVAHLATRRRFK